MTHANQQGRRGPVNSARARGRNALLRTGVLFTLLIARIFPAHANYLQVSDVRIVNQNLLEHSAIILFDVTWENSWRYDSGFESGNYDAAWLFCKYRTAGGNWSHVNISANGYIIPAGGSLEIPSDLKGAFIYRSTPGEGSIGFQSIGLKWNYGAAGISDTALIDIKVFGIEMVYITEGNFVAGSGGTELHAFTATTINTSLTSAAPAGSDGIGGTPSGGYPSGQIAPSAQWPNGYHAFYCMKYEVTQGQYAEFLNCLTPAQAVNRYYPPGSTTKLNNRYNIVFDTVTQSYYSTAQNIPDNFVSWEDAATYADWSALRPMTELEFEKACRGPLAPVPNEYAWGTASVCSYVYQISDKDSSDEHFTNLSATSGNASYMLTIGGQVAGPGRNGVYAASSVNHTRIETGGSYYGVMELSGGLLERCIGLNYPEGRNFTGEQGDGMITAEGDYSVAGWPGYSGTGATTRGGRWNVEKERMRVSDRFSYADASPSRLHNAGCRFVRSQF